MLRLSSQREARKALFQETGKVSPILRRGETPLEHREKALVEGRRDHKVLS